MSSRRLVGWGTGLLFGLGLWTASPLFAQQRFDEPALQGSRLDWCLVWGERCGRPAADRFCAEKGFGPAKRFEKADDVGPTRVLADGRRCDDPRCDGFAFIECAPRAVLAVPPAPLEAARGAEARDRPSGPPRAAAPGRQGARAPLDVARPAFRLAYPPGASLWWYQKDLIMTGPALAEGGDVTLFYDVAKVPHADRALWQVTTEPFPPFEGTGPTILDPPGLALTGSADPASGSFPVPFGDLGAPTVRAAVAPDWYVRVLPVLGDPPLVVGRPSNVVPVFDRAPPAPSDEELGEVFNYEYFVDPGVPVNLVVFEFVPARRHDRWPPGCEVYRGAGYQKDPLEWVSEVALGAVDWASETYAEIKSFVVEGVVALLPFVPPEVASFALDVALASAGIPPSLPNLDQMMSQGADYLANQMVDELAAQVPAGSAMAELGKARLREELKEHARTALLDNARKARAALEEKAGPYCQTKIDPPYLKVTVRNNGDRAVRDLRIDVIPSTNLLKPGMGFTIDAIAPGEELAVPLDIWSRMDLWHLPQDPRSQISDRTRSNWFEAFNTTPFTFTVRGGRTMGYYASEKEGYRYEEHPVDDGTGIDYTTPEMLWVNQRFGGP